MPDITLIGAAAQTEADILDLLSDGEPHSFEEVTERCGGEYPQRVLAILFSTGKIAYINAGVEFWQLNEHALAA